MTATAVQGVRASRAAKFSAAAGLKQQLNGAPFRLAEDPQDAVARRPPDVVDVEAGAWAIRVPA